LLLTSETVEGIHKHGGTLLGSSRGPQDAAAMVDNLVARGVGVLFAIGGDGTLRGASVLQQEIARRGLPIPVIGIPKTIDNDLNWVERSFGFTTAVDEAVRAIAAAHVEARGVRDGIGLVKLMGRHSGFIAAHATLASGEVNFCLIPEVPFRLEGEKGLLKALEERLDRRNHAVIVVAEGAGQELASHRDGKDASGNLKLGDVGVYLREALDAGFQKMGRAVTIKYIDPSYMIRSLPADAFDAELCLGLGQHAVHAAFAGRTSMMVGYWNGCFTHVPLSLAIQKRRQVELTGALWQRVLVSTGQPGDLGAGGV
jgi:6-phosphofructokinase 1